MSKEIKQKKNRDRYQEATDRIIALMEEGTVPWRKPWDNNKTGFSLPHNGGSKRQYRGLNAALLMCHPDYVQTGDGRFYTFNQIKENGWSLEKGTKGTKVYFFKKIEVDNDDPEANEDKKVIPFLKDYPVWHASQIKGCPEYKPEITKQTDFQKNMRVQVTLEASGADIRTGGVRAFYQPAGDFIQIPPVQAFSSEASHASTALHELAHWTGHESRLDRQFGLKGDEDYAREELRAELASVFLCGELGINPEMEQHASYLDNWLAVLKEDKFEIFRAASDAQRITDFVMDFVPELKTDAELADEADLPPHLKKEMGIEEGIKDEIPFDVNQPTFVRGPM
jgi:antirestriction protein ArdC